MRDGTKKFESTVCFYVTAVLDIRAINDIKLGAETLSDGIIRDTTAALNGKWGHENNRDIIRKVEIDSIASGTVIVKAGKKSETLNDL